MTIFCQDLNSCHIRMQSVPKLDLFSKPGCLLDSDCEFDKFSSMAMSVGINDSDSTSIVTSNKNNNSNNKTPPSRSMMGKRQGKRPGRKPTKIDERAKLERSRQSAKECRARKKLRYQYLEELVSNREKAVVTLRDELEMCKTWCHYLDEGKVPDDLEKKLATEEAGKDINSSMKSEANYNDGSPDSEDGKITPVDFSFEFTSFGEDDNAMEMRYSPN